MLIKAKSLKNYNLNCKDGEVGKVKDFYFDDHQWVVRYLIADNGNWLIGKQVLISPLALGSINKKNELIRINLNKKQIQNSPPLNNDQPVSRQFEESYYGYYGWPTYWSGLNIWGHSPHPIADSEEQKVSGQYENYEDTHLRSTNNVSGYHIQAIDGEIGHVEDFIIDDKTWTIRYLIIDTNNLLPGKKVLISPQWIDQVSWNDMKVTVKLSRESIRQSPEYSEEALLTRDYETQLHRYYNRNVYWQKKLSNRKHLL